MSSFQSTFLVLTSAILDLSVGIAMHPGLWHTYSSLTFFHFFLVMYMALTGHATLTIYIFLILCICSVNSKNIYSFFSAMALIGQTHIYFFIYFIYLFLFYLFLYTQLKFLKKIKNKKIYVYKNQNQKENN